MKRNRLNVLLCGSATFAFFGAGILTPGCESLLQDPRAFFTEDPCNLYNCDNLFYLRGEHGEPELDANHDESETVDAG